MVQARIHQGRIELESPIPAEWEGQRVKILPLTPDDPIPDLEERLAALQMLGPMEFDPEEHELIDRALAQLDRMSREAIHNIPSNQH